MNIIGTIRPIRGVIALLARVPGWLVVTAGSPAARRRERGGFGALAKACGITIAIEGAPNCGGTLFVSNHVSWADIPVYGATLDAAFVAKAEVAGWPLVGRMAKRMGTIFVARDRPGTSGAQADAIRARLRSGRDVLLFAEGTTSDGTGILPFRSSLFAAADAAARIQPVVLSWRAADGGALSPERLRAVAWVGDDALLPSVVRLARGRTRAVMRFLPPIPASVPRKALAAAARDAIVAAYAAAPNLPR